MFCKGYRPLLHGVRITYLGWCHSFIALQSFSWIVLLDWFYHSSSETIKIEIIIREDWNYFERKLTKKVKWFARDLKNWMKKNQLEILSHFLWNRVTQTPHFSPLYLIKNEFVIRTALQRCINQPYNEGSSICSKLESRFCSFLEIIMQKKEVDIIRTMTGFHLALIFG